MSENERPKLKERPIIALEMALRHMFTQAERDLVETHRKCWNDDTGTLGSKWVDGRPMKWTRAEQDEAARIYERMRHHGLWLVREGNDVRWLQAVNVRGETVRMLPGWIWPEHPDTKHVKKHIGEALERVKRGMSIEREPGEEG